MDGISGESWMSLWINPWKNHRGHFRMYPMKTAKKESQQESLMESQHELLGEGKEEFLEDSYDKFS